MKVARRVVAGLLASILLLAGGCDRNRESSVREGNLPDSTTGADWASYGGAYDESHSSPLTEINTGTVARLGLVAAVDLPDVHNGGTTPLAVDGVVYLTVDQTIVRAVDARTGKVNWVFDPRVADKAGQKLRFGWGPRGLAYGDGRIYVGTTDGRLIALDAKTGKQVWAAQTTEPDDGRYISGAPRYFRGLVIIGHGGADYSMVRGYVTAYDAVIGAQRWRFHTVPGDPAKGFENAAMKAAAKTWTGDWWKLGGGGTVWNAITYDPDLDTIYIGTGNGAPWNTAIRSPGGGDNLYLCSIVALDATTGAYKWHYQLNPAEGFDYNAAMDMTLATLTIDGKPRKVLMQAPKNGFFYVLDRISGKPISAEKFAKVNWASKIDLASGRPVENPELRDQRKPFLLWPGNLGAHSWAPMSFNRGTGLVYIPKIEMPAMLDASGVNPRTWQAAKGLANTGYATYVGGVPKDAGTSSLIAWDPVRQRKVWEVPNPGVWNGGTMTTAGKLVFQGDAEGRFNAFDALSGKKLWSFFAQRGISGAPITFTAGGKQFVAVVAGWGGAGASYLGNVGAQHGWHTRSGTNRLLIFALGGTATLPELPAGSRALVTFAPAGTFRVDPAKAAAGGPLFMRSCAVCHGAGVVAGGQAPDLRESPVPLDADAFEQVVRQGLLLERGMPRYAELSDTQLEQLRHFIRAQTAKKNNAS